jgi:hypothetical protein
MLQRLSFQVVQAMSKGLEGTFVFNIPNAQLDFRHAQGVQFGGGSMHSTWNYGR